MNSLSPNIEIKNHFENLIHGININIEQSLKKYKEDQVLGELNFFRVENRNVRKNYDLYLEYSELDKSSEKNKCEAAIEWSESTKVIDYLNQVRERTIEELGKAKQDSLNYLKNSSCDLDQLIESKDFEEMKSRLFAHKFYFQVLCNPKNLWRKCRDTWVFSLYTIAVDFYLSPSDIDFLERLINYEEKKSRPYSDDILIFDEKFILIQSIAENFYENLKTQQYPSLLISFRKEDLLNIRSVENPTLLNKRGEIDFNFSCSYLSKLENIDFYSVMENARMEGLSSLKSLTLRLDSIDGSSFSNMKSLRNLALSIRKKLDNDLLTKLFETCPYIEELTLVGDHFSSVNFDRFANLKKLTLCGNLLSDFNFDLFKNIYNQLEHLSLEFYNMNDEIMSKLLSGQYFPKLSSLEISSNKITRLEKKLFDGCPMLRSLSVSESDKLSKIDRDAFWNMRNLRELVLKDNKNLSELDAELFYFLDNLEVLNLEHNQLNRFDLKIMGYIVNIKEICLSENPILNKIEVVNFFKRPKIQFSYSI